MLLEEARRASMVAAAEMLLGVREGCGKAASSHLHSQGVHSQQPGGGGLEEAAGQAT
jgi:hypothetical protein